MLDRSTLREQLFRGFLDHLLAVLVVKVETGHRCVPSRCRRARHVEHDALGDAVEATVRLEGDRLPLVRPKRPIAHLIEQRATCGRPRRLLSKLNNFTSSMLDAMCKLVHHPIIVDKARGILSTNLRVSDIREH